MKRVQFKPKRFKKCCICKGSFKPFSTTAKTCFNIECAIEKVRIDNEKKKAEKIKGLRVKLTKEDLPWQHKQTQIAFNKMRRLEEFLWFEERGLEPSCISCDKKNADWACGHYSSVGSNGNLRYDRKNTYLQCNKRCNKELSANKEGTKTTRGYNQGLVDRFGEEKGKEIIDYCKNSNQVKRWTCDELEKMRKGFNARIRRLQQILN